MFVIIPESFFFKNTSKNRPEHYLCTHCNPCKYFVPGREQQLER